LSNQTQNLKHYREVHLLMTPIYHYPNYLTKITFLLRIVK